MHPLHGDPATALVRHQAGQDAKRSRLGAVPAWLSGSESPWLELGSRGRRVAYFGVWGPGSRQVDTFFATNNQNYCLQNVNPLSTIITMINITRTAFSPLSTKAKGTPSAQTTAPAAARRTGGRGAPPRWTGGARRWSGGSASLAARALVSSTLICLMIKLFLVKILRAMRVNSSTQREFV